LGYKLCEFFGLGCHSVLIRGWELFAAIVIGELSLLPSEYLTLDLWYLC
jgi:hypothetical protein